MATDLLSRPSPEQARAVNWIAGRLDKLGYSGELLQRNYELSDWFERARPARTVPLAAFGQTPPSYDTACLAVVLADGYRGADLIRDYRALGAPIAFEISSESIALWRVAENPVATDCRITAPLTDLEGLFDRHAETWRPDALLRSKNLAAVDRSGPRQMDFFDTGLIPALEHHIREKLDPLLREVLHEAAVEYRRSRNQRIPERELFRLVFWVLTGKILHDRGVPGFTELSAGSDPKEVLARVKAHYGDNLGNATPSVVDRRTVSLVHQMLWTDLDFRNLSVEVLAFIYENTLVSDSLRRDQAIHATPPALARYILQRLPFEETALASRRVVEPCCGHATFLVAAMLRLRALLPPSLDALARHAYFKEMLEGYELDPFAIEVSRLSLMLADFPNPNGWRLHKANVFDSPEFETSLASARFVTCNPPFNQFEPKARIPGLSMHKPAALVQTVLQHLHPTGCLGLVMPHQVVDGHAYRDVRAALAARFSSIEVVSLPDKVFTTAEPETALIIAGEPRLSDRTSVFIDFAFVREHDWPRFQTIFEPTRRERASRALEEAEVSFLIRPFGELWGRLAHLPRLGDVAKIHRGIEWNVPFKAHRSALISANPRAGFRKGLQSAAGCLLPFQQPDTEYLNTGDRFRLYKAHDLPWHRPKVLVNANRRTRGTWRIAAFADDQGLVASQNFAAIWSTGNITPTALAAVLNGPLANVFVSVTETGRHLTNETLKAIPIPTLSSNDMSAIDGLVAEYLRAVRHEAHDLAVQTLLRIDATVLRGYDLPPRLERQLLDFLRDEVRPTPFPFPNYYPAGFTAFIPLWMLISPEFARTDAAQFIAALPKVSDPTVLEALAAIE